MMMIFFEGDILIIFAISLFHSIDCTPNNDNHKKGAKTFGPFNIEISSLARCNTTEPIDEDIYYDSVMWYNLTDAKPNTLEGRITIKREHRVIKASYITDLYKDGNYKQIFNRTTENPCADIILGPILNQVYHCSLTCIIKKGVYRIPPINLEMYSHKVLGNSFFYQKARVLSAFFSDRGMTVCYNILGQSKSAIPVKKPKKHLVNQKL